MAFAGGTRFGVYEITGLIGVGGMGEVYRATDTTLGREVAIKVLPDSLAANDDRIARFEREAKTLASLNHTNIGQIYGLERRDGTTALVMELIEGPTLAHRLMEGPIAVEDTLTIAMQIADALEAAHALGIVHRDLKPANIKLRPDGAVKVLDFGIAKALQLHATSGEQASVLTTPAMTELGVVLGTAAYMSPEQARGKPVDERADIWAFGCVLFEMLTGQPAFGAEDVTTTLARVLERDADLDSLPRMTPSTVRSTIKLCLEKEVRKRVADIRDVKLALTGSFETRTSDLVGAIATRPIWWRPLPVGIVASMLIAVIAGFSAWHLRPEPPESNVPRFRFTVSPPVGAVFTPSAYHQSISPDGQRIAFIVRRQGDRRSELWVRSLDSADAEVLAGTEDAVSLFWSPDSQFLGFFTAAGAVAGQGQTLKRVPARGGPVVTLSPNVTRHVNGSHGTWSGDVILFAADASGGVSAVTPSGGDPKPVTSIDPSSEDTSHTFPSFLPDGDRFLYLAQPSNTVYLASLSSPAATPLLTADSKAVYAPPGYLLYVRGGVLLGQPFDATRGRLTGEPVALAAPVSSNPSTGGGRFSVSDNGVLAYRGGSVGATGELVWFDRSGQALGSPVDSLGWYQAIDLSVDGDLAMAVADTDTAPTRVFTVDLPRGGRVPLGKGTSRSPVWSPDGSEVAFSSRQDGGKWALYRADRSGAAEPQVIHESANALDATDWSRDGIIAYVERDAQSEADIWFVSATGDKAPTPFLSTMYAEESAQFSPDGRWVAYVSNVSGRFEVYARQTSGSGQHTISTEGGTLPRWREGELVYFDGQYLVSVAVQADESRLRLGSPQQLWRAEFRRDIVGSGEGPTLWAYSYAPSPDGQQMLLMRVSEEQGSVPIVILTDWLTALGQVD